MIINKTRTVRFFSALLSALLMLSACGCQTTKPDKTPPSSTDSDSVIVSTDSFDKDLPSSESLGLAENNLQSHHYDQLSEDEQTLYVAILDSWTNNDDSLTVKNVDYELLRGSIAHVVDAVYHDRPECFRYARGYKLDGTIREGINDDTVIVTWAKNTYKNIPPEEEVKLQDAISEILAAASAGADDYERVKIAHDCLVNRIAYDHSALSDDTGLTHWRNTVYSALVEGSAVCGGYARSFQLILNRLGIPCTVVSGFGENQYHAWSLAILDGEYYLFDVTWDDHADTPPDYKYFALTTEEMQKNHTPNSDFTYPTCTATACNYYVREGLLLDTYSFEAADRIISRQSAGSAATAVLKFRSKTEFDRAVDDLITSKNWSKLTALKDAGKLLYSNDEDQLIITIYFQTED